jgi:hypothetical protein
MDLNNEGCGVFSHRRTKLGSTALCKYGPQQRRNSMRYVITIATLAVLGSSGISLAQTPAPGGAPRGGAVESIQPRLNLSEQQKQAVDRGLSGQPSQHAPADLQMRVGEPLPSSMTPHAMPNSVTQQVPETKSYEFVKLMDRVLMVDPTDRSIAEIIPIPGTTTTGAAPSRGR